MTTEPQALSVDPPPRSTRAMLHRVISNGVATAFYRVADDLVVIHYGHLRHLRHETGAKPAPLIAAIVVDVVVFVGFFVYRIRTDWVVIASFVVFAIFVAGGETYYARRDNDAASP